MMYTESEINLMRMKSTVCKLDGPAMWWAADAEKLVSICNGVGADWMPDWAVEALSFIFRDYAEAAAIHDCRYYLAPEGTREGADVEFKENCLKLWKHRYGKMRWFSPAAWGDRHKIGLAYKALKLFGKKAWEEAGKRYEVGEMREEVSSNVNV